MSMLEQLQSAARARRAKFFPPNPPRIEPPRQIKRPKQAAAEAKPTPYWKRQPAPPTPLILHAGLEALIAEARRIVRRDPEIRPPAASDILRIVSRFYAVRLNDILSDRRNPHYVRPRQVTMYLCKTLTSLSYKVIGRAMGGKDHTTILHGHQKIERLRKTDERLALELRVIQKIIAQEFVVPE